MRRARFRILLAAFACSLITPACGPAAVHVAFHSGHASPSCLQYRAPLEAGPGVSTFTAQVNGPQPFFAGEDVWVAGKSYGLSPPSTAGQSGWYGAQRVQLYLLANIRNAFWYGMSTRVARCVQRRGVLLGESDVAHGGFTWSGSLPQLRPGSSWSLVAVADNGAYYIDSLAAPGLQTSAIVAPYELVAGPAVDAMPAPDTAVANDNLRIVGLHLPANGRFRVALVGTPPGAGSARTMTLGEVTVASGRLNANFPLPDAVQAHGGSYTALLLKGHDVAYSLPITVLPPPKAPQQVPPPSPAAYLHMTTATSGFAVYGNDLLRTVDGGRTWADVTPAGVALGYLSSEAGLPQEPAWFYGQSDVWIVVPNGGQSTIYRSTDAGASWNRSALAISGVRELDFVNPSDGYALAGFNTLYRTEDGASMWQVVSASGLPQGTDGIGFQTPAIGWATTQDEGRTPVLMTRDGGATWGGGRVPALPVAKGDALMGMVPAIFPGGSGVIGLVDWITRRLYFLTSQRSKAAWAVSTPIAGGKPFTPPLYSFSSATQGIAWMGVSLKVTRDGGRRWTTLPLPQPLQDFWNSWPQLDAVSSQAVFALVRRNGSYLVLSSANYGHTWAEAGTLPTLGQ